MKTVCLFLSCLHRCHSIVFVFEDSKKLYDYAAIQCFRAREIDGKFESIQRVEAAHFHMKLNEDLKVDIDLPNFNVDVMNDVGVK